MEIVCKSFLGQKHFHHRLGCGAFDFNPDTDLIVAIGKNDPGVFLQAHEYLRSYGNSHRHALVILDAEWGGAPSPARIKARIEKNLTLAGWPSGTTKAIVIDPELENWIWMDSPHVVKALHWPGPGELRSWLVQEGFGFVQSGKPERPKEAVEAVLHETRQPRSSSIYGRIVKNASVKRCKDPAFKEMVETLRNWFPATCS